MIRAPQDRWFDRFRRTGDPRVLAKVFDRTAPELWRVAAHLCRDRHAAEDAVQGTFLAAIEDRDGWDATRPLLPWLLGMLANRVRENRRRAARVLDAQCLVRTGERDPAQLAEHGEFGAAFAAALQRVAEPYRSAVERHLVAGLAAHEIAGELGVPAGTVRMRLHRGLEQLRQKLPQGFVAGGAVALQVPPETLAAMREVVLAKVHAGAAVAAAGSGPVVLGVVGILLMKKTMVVVALSALVSLSFWTWWPGAADPAAIDPASASTVVAAKVLPVAADAVPAEQPAQVSEVERVAVTPAPVLGTTGRLRLVLRHGGNARPLADVNLQVVAGLPGPSTPRDGRLPPGFPAVVRKSESGTTDAQGSATFELPPGFAEVTPSALQLAQPIGAEIVAGSETELIVDVPVCLSLDLEVVDADGRPIAEARIVGHTSFDRGSLVERELGSTGADGHWREPFVEPHVEVRAVKDGYAASPPLSMWQRAQQAQLRLGREQATVDGTVFVPGGTPAASVGVAIQSHAEGSVGERPIVVRADANGRYECAHVPAGKCTVLAWREVEGGSRRFTRREVTAVALTRTTADLQFHSGAQVVATARDAVGSPLRNASVAAVWRPEKELWSHLADGSAMATTDHEGRASIADLMPGHYELQVRWNDFAKTQQVDLVEGQEFRFDAVFDASAWLEVQVFDEANAPLDGWEVTVAAGDSARCAIADREGLVRFEGLVAGSIEIVVHKRRGVLPSVMRSVTTNTRHAIVIPKTAMPEATLRGSVQVAGGSVLDAVRAELAVAEDPTRGSIRQRLNGAAFQFENLPAGAYNVSLRRMSDGEYLAMPRRVDVGAGATVDLGSIALQAPSDVRIEVSCSDGASVRKPFVDVVVAGRARIFSRAPQASDTRGIMLQQISVGSFELLVWGEDIAPVFVPLTTDGKAVTMPIVASRAVATTFRFVFADGKRVPGVVTFRQQGVELLAERVYDAASYVRGLLPGSCRIEFEGPDGLRGAAEFTVGSTAGAPIEVRIAR